jgi:hypothetical protein
VFIGFPPNVIAAIFISFLRFQKYEIISELRSLICSINLT